jgi:hypothetical protein
VIFAVICLGAMCIVIQAVLRGLFAAARCVCTALGLPLATDDRTKERS